MISSILVALDGSPIAEQALPHACCLARTTGASIVLIRAAPHSHVPGAPASDVRVTVRDAEAYLEPLQHRLRGDGFTVTTLALHADPLRAIRYAVRAYGTDIIVMSTHSRSALGRVLLGSVAQDVLYHTTVPLLLVHVAAQPHILAFDRYRKILIPLDGTEFGESALTYIARDALGHALDLVLLRALPPAAPMLTPSLPHYALDPAHAAERMQERAVQYLARAAAAHLRGWSYRTQVIGEQPAGAIRAVADMQDIDLIVMATHARTGFARLAYGSVADQVLRYAPVPVLLLHGIQEGTHEAAPYPTVPEHAVSLN